MEDCSSTCEQATRPGVKRDRLCIIMSVLRERVCFPFFVALGNSFLGGALTRILGQLSINGDPKQRTKTLTMPLRPPSRHITYLEIWMRLFYRCSGFRVASG